MRFSLPTCVAWIAVVAALAAPAQTTKPASSFNPAPVFEAQAGALEAEIGGLMQKRLDGAAASALRELEMRIDVRIVARMLIARASESNLGSDAQAAAWIRSGHLLDAAAAVERELDAGSRTPSASSAQALKALHDLTFKLADGKQQPDPDQASRIVASALMTALGSDPSDLDRLPQMRPPGAGISRAQSQPAGPRSLEQLSTRARELPISPPLRAQLLAVSQAGLNAARDPKHSADADETRGVLDEAVTLAEGLGANTAVDRDDRVKMEAQIAQGLAMFLDPRTRSMGQNRVRGLGRYRQMLQRMEELRLGPDMLKRIAPALAGTREEGDVGAKLLAAVVTFAEQDARLTALSVGKSSELPTLYARAAEEAKRRASAERDAFLEMASSAKVAKNRGVLQMRANAMRQALDALDAITKTPAVIKTLNSLRPKPFGGVEKRAQAALAAWTPDSADTARDASTQNLQRLAHVAEFVEQFNHPTTLPKEDGILQKYTGGSLASFDDARKTAIATLVNVAATANQPLDDKAFAPVETSSVILSAIELALRAEQASTQGDALMRWADWGVDPQALEAVLEPYQLATADAVRGFARGRRGSLETWDAQRRRYEPVLKVLASVAGRAGACAALPSGRTGALATLITPLNEPANADIRAMRLGIDAWHHFQEAKDQKNADAALAALAGRLSH